jgi:hypothetical protein
VVVLVLPKWVAPNPPVEPALKPKFDWVVGCKPAESPEFCCPPPTTICLKVMFGFIPQILRQMAAMGVPLGEFVIALKFTVAAVSAMAAILVMGIPPGERVMALPFKVTVATTATLVFRGGGVGVCTIVALLGESWI